MGRWSGRIRAEGLSLEAEIWYEMPEETHQGFRWHGSLSTSGALRGAAGRGLRLALSSPEASHTVKTDVGTIQIDSVEGDRIAFHGCGSPAGALAEAIRR